MKSIPLYACSLLWLLLATSACAPRPALPPGVHWNSRTGEFRWWQGAVTLPPGMEYRSTSSDSFAGQFRSMGRALVIEHDMGGYAGVYATPKGADTFEERIVSASRVWVARHTYANRLDGRYYLFAVTFPDNGLANFFLYSSDEKDAAIIQRIALSFRPAPPA
jgi:hypothetical protein